MKTKRRPARDAPKLRRLERRVDVLEKTQDVTLGLLQRAFQDLERLQTVAARNRTIDLVALATLGDLGFPPQEPSPP